VPARIIQPAVRNLPAQDVASLEVPSAASDSNFDGIGEGLFISCAGLQELMITTDKRV
jgi:hypothetical protein